MSKSIEMENGISVKANPKTTVDLQGMRTLVESGVPIAEVAKAFHITETSVKRYQKQGGWLTPSKIAKLRKEIEEKQAAIYKRTGKTMDVNEIKAEIWKERAEQMRERTFQIANSALEGVTDDRAKNFVQNPLGLSHLTNVIRAITGEDKDDRNGPQVAVNIALLSSRNVTDSAAPSV